jgi:hypothetical protein
MVGEQGNIASRDSKCFDLMDVASPMEFLRTNASASMKAALLEVMHVYNLRLEA